MRVGPGLVYPECSVSARLVQPVRGVCPRLVIPAFRLKYGRCCRDFDVRTTPLCLIVLLALCVLAGLIGPNRIHEALFVVKVPKLTDRFRVPRSEPKFANRVSTHVQPRQPRRLTSLQASSGKRYQQGIPSWRS